MSDHVESLRRHLSSGVRTARQLADHLGVSQPTVSRAIAALGDDVVRIGAARSIQYALRDAARGLPDMPVYRVDTQGRLRKLGMLIPVRPDGFVMRQEDGVTLHSAGLPWWLFDMRPQGYLGRAYVARHSQALGLPDRLVDWNDTHALHALLAHGHDVVGNLLLGDTARQHFLVAPEGVPLTAPGKAAAYAELAQAAARGEAPGSSAGGEQPKFTAMAATPDGPRHMIVKFSEAEASPVTERWRDLLLAEHLALDTLRRAGLPAAVSRIVDHAGQRFLEVERFDRVGPLGRRALHSLAALDAEFVGTGAGTWPTVVRPLASAGQITPEAADVAELLWAFGTLIGNTDMHHGNLSFIADHGRPYAIAPAYDMTPMAFAPHRSGALPDTLPAASIHASVSAEHWRRAEALARAFLARVGGEQEFSPRFRACVDALAGHVDAAGEKIGRLG
ncbi:type II toxin-antitoxin system HipA family toxin YjjJ [Denitromonas sp.]|uniref:type II toxin-antitoxin system HipA family toxin YjjJ n=1 Tax=Denitromonas sp. TaxID=2734609 RepID=UPI002B002436|nr:type II toxin-antitoxin system HipA family toxin YjjJ [Denitromonas sp.]